MTVMEAVNNRTDIATGHPIFRIIGKTLKTASVARMAKSIGIQEISSLFPSVLPLALILFINAWAIRRLTPIKFGDEDF
jgi:hypothetical protein